MKHAVMFIAVFVVVLVVMSGCTMLFPDEKPVKSKPVQNSNAGLIPEQSANEQPPALPDSAPSGSPPRIP